MKNKAVVLEYILAILGYVEGAILCISLVFLPLGIYVVSGAGYFLAATKLTDSEIGVIRNHITNYAILFSIMLFPIGLISLLIVPLCASHNISVEDGEMAQEPSSTNKEPQTASQRVLTEEEIAKLDELKKYRDKGVITEDEFIKAKKSLFEG